MPTIVTTRNNNTVQHTGFGLQGSTQTSFVQSPVFPNPLDIPETCCKECIVLPAFAELGNPTDIKKNDTSTVVYAKYILADTFTFALEMNSGSGFTEIAQLNNNNLGLLIDEPTFTAFVLNWNAVLNTFGEGYFRIRTDASGIVNGQFFTLPYCLAEFTDFGANYTVRFDSILKGKQNDINSFRTVADYGSNGVPFSIRVLGRFGKMNVANNPIEQESATGITSRSRIEQTVKYNFESGLLYYLTHEQLMFNVTIADDLLVTDYNLDKQYYDIERIPIQIVGDYSPDYQFKLVKIFDVDVEFQIPLNQIGRGNAQNC